MIFHKDECIKNRYKIISLLGAGSTGEIYTAEDLVLKRNVTLKVFSKIHGISNARIQREAELLGTLNHPNVVTAYDVDIYNGHYYLVLEHVKGNSLQHELRTRKIPMKQVLKYSMDIAFALDHIHRKNIVHRDIKPSNILIDASQSTAYITDFGIGKYDVALNDITCDMTLTGNPIGTIAYMAPEQINGENISSKADIFSFGLVVCEMLMGGFAYKVSSLEEIVNSRKEAWKYVDKVKETHPSTPPKLLELIKTMLSPTASSRPDASEIISKLDELGEEVNIEEFDQEPLEINNTVCEEEVVAPEFLKAHVPDNPYAKGSGFFSDEESRHKEFLKSIEFYRDHLNVDYKTLQSQAKVAFWLWVGVLAVGFVVIVVAAIMLMQGKLIEGSIAIVSEAFILYCQKMFQIREDYYRQQADKKTAHLELGNNWNLAIQSIAGIGNDAKKEEKLIELINGLIVKVSKDSDAKNDNNSSNFT